MSPRAVDGSTTCEPTMITTSPAAASRRAAAREAVSSDDESAAPPVAAATIAAASAGLTVAFLPAESSRVMMASSSAAASVWAPVRRHRFEHQRTCSQSSAHARRQVIVRPHPTHVRGAGTPERVRCRGRVSLRWSRLLRLRAQPTHRQRVWPGEHPRAAGRPGRSPPVRRHRWTRSAPRRESPPPRHQP